PHGRSGGPSAAAPNRNRHAVGDGELPRAAHAQRRRAAPLRRRARPRRAHRQDLGRVPAACAAPARVKQIGTANSVRSPPPFTGEGQGGGRQKDRAWALTPSPPSPARGGGSTPSKWRVNLTQ